MQQIRNRNFINPSFTPLLSLTLQKFYSPCGEPFTRLRSTALFHKIQQGCVTRGPLAKSGPGAEVLWPVERSITWSEHHEFSRVLPIFRGWTANCLTRRAWHMQLWPVGQSGYVHIFSFWLTPMIWTMCLRQTRKQNKKQISFVGSQFMKNYRHCGIMKILYLR